MRAYLLRNKFHLLASTLIFCLFIFTIFLRQERLESEIIPGEEWITAHVLITNQIWEQNGGPSRFNFNPVYSYGDGSKFVKSMGGLMDEDGHYYYVSYPPFAFLFSYYGMKLLGGHSVYNLRALNLILHFFCAFFIYRLLFKLSAKSTDHFSIAGVFCAFLYLFSSGTLWIHSVLFFSDILVQLFIILGLLLTSKLILKDYQSEIRVLSALGLVFFLASYTEWMGILLSFITGISFLVMYFIRKKRVYLKAFTVIGLSSILALSLTVFQYSSISTFEDLLQTSAHKYQIRSGHQGAAISEGGFDISNPDSYSKIEFNFNQHFLMVTNIFGIFSFLIIPLIIWKKTRQKMTGLRLKIFVFSLLLLPVLIHLIAFFNFNAIHDFAQLKIGLLAILAIGVFLLLIEHSVDFKLKLVFTGLLIFIGISRGQRDYERYLNFYDLDKINVEKIASAKIMKANSEIDQMAFSNMKNLNPEYIYLSKHTPFYIADTSNLTFLMDVFELDTTKYYHHSGDTLKYILELTWDGKHVEVVNQMDITNRP